MHDRLDSGMPVSDALGAGTRNGARRATSAGARSPAVAWYRIRKVRGCAVVTAGGEIDLATAPSLRDTLLEAVERSPRVVIDVSEVTFLDCSALAAMVGALRHARENDGAVRLVGAAGVTLRVLSLTRLDQVFPVDAGVGDAVRQMRARRSQS